MVRAFCGEAEESPLSEADLLRLKQAAAFRRLLGEVGQVGVT
jgi:hypothetical protein